MGEPWLDRPTLSRGIRSFLDAYRPACLGVVNASLRLDTVEDGVPVRFVRPWELELVLGELGKRLDPEALAMLESKSRQAFAAATRDAIPCSSPASGDEERIHGAPPVPLATRLWDQRFRVMSVALRR